MKAYFWSNLEFRDYAVMAVLADSVDDARQLAVEELQRLYRPEVEWAEKNGRGPTSAAERHSRDIQAVVKTIPLEWTGKRAGVFPVYD